MIKYEKFKELFNSLDSKRHPEIEIYFKNTSDVYMIVKFEDYISFGKCGITSKENPDKKFKDLDELYITEKDGICLKRDWNNISDILIDLAFSVIDDKEEIEKIYKVKL